jgi:hypothetical protein
LVVCDEAYYETDVKPLKKEINYVKKVSYKEQPDDTIHFSKNIKTIHSEWCLAFADPKRLGFGLIPTIDLPHNDTVANRGPYIGDNYISGNLGGLRRYWTSEAPLTSEFGLSQGLSIYHNNVNAYPNDRRTIFRNIFLGAGGEAACPAIVNTVLGELPYYDNNTILFNKGTSYLLDSPLGYIGDHSKHKVVGLLYKKLFLNGQIEKININKYGDFEDNLPNATDNIQEHKDDIYLNYKLLLKDINITEFPTPVTSYEDTEFKNAANMFTMPDENDRGDINNGHGDVNIHATPNIGGGYSPFMEYNNNFECWESDTHKHILDYFDYYLDKNDWFNPSNDTEVNNEHKLYNNEFELMNNVNPDKNTDLAIQRQQQTIIAGQKNKFTLKSNSIYTDADETFDNFGEKHLKKWSEFNGNMFRSSDNYDHTSDLQSDMENKSMKDWFSLYEKGALIKNERLLMKGKMLNNGPRVGYHQQKHALVAEVFKDNERYKGYKKFAIPEFDEYVGKSYYSSVETDYRQKHYKQYKRFAFDAEFKLQTPDDKDAEPINIDLTNSVSNDNVAYWRGLPGAGSTAYDKLNATITMLNVEDLDKLYDTECVYPKYYKELGREYVNPMILYNKHIDKKFIYDVNNINEDNHPRIDERKWQSGHPNPGRVDIRYIREHHYYNYMYEHIDYNGLPGKRTKLQLFNKDIYSSLYCNVNALKFFNHSYEQDHVFLPWADVETKLNNINYNNTKPPLTPPNDFATGANINNYIGNPKRMLDKEWKADYNRHFFDLPEANMDDIQTEGEKDYKQNIIYDYSNLGHKMQIRKGCISARDLTNLKNSFGSESESKLTKFNFYNNQVIHNLYSWSFFSHPLDKVELKPIEKEVHGDSHDYNIFKDDGIKHFMKKKHTELKTYLTTKGDGFDKPVFTKDDVSDKIKDKTFMIDFGSKYTYVSGLDIEKKQKLREITDNSTSFPILSRILDKLVDGNYDTTIFTSNKPIYVYYNGIPKGLKLSQNNLTKYVLSIVRDNATITTTSGGGIAKNLVTEPALNLSTLYSYMGSTIFKEIFIDDNTFHNVFIRSMYNYPLNIDYNIFSESSQLSALMKYFTDEIMRTPHANLDFKPSDLPSFPIQFIVVLLREILKERITNYNINSEPDIVQGICQIMNVLTSRREEDFSSDDRSEILRLKNNIESQLTFIRDKMLEAKGICVKNFTDFIDKLQKISLTQIQLAPPNPLVAQPLGAIPGAIPGAPGQQVLGERMLGVGEIGDSIQVDKYNNFIKNILGISDNDKTMLTHLKNVETIVGKVINNIVMTPGITQGFEKDLYVIDSFIYDLKKFQRLFDPPEKTKLKDAPTLSEVDVSSEEVKHKSIPSDAGMTETAIALKKTDKTTEMIFSIKNEANTIITNSPVVGNIQTSALVGLSQPNSVVPQAKTLNTYGTLPGSSFWTEFGSVKDLIQRTDFKYLLPIILKEENMIATLTGLVPEDRLLALEKLYELRTKDVEGFLSSPSSPLKKHQLLDFFARTFSDGPQFSFEPIVKLLDKECDKGVMSKNEIVNNPIAQGIIAYNHITSRLSALYKKEKGELFYTQVVPGISSP